MNRSFNLVAVALIVLGVCTRLVPHPANFTALGALALWSTTLLRSKTWALILPLVALLVSDVFLAQSQPQYSFSLQILWVYGAFLMMGALSLWIQPRLSWVNAVLGALVASLLFYLVTNFGVWAEGLIYPMNGNGLMESYVAGLPFLKNQIAGDLFYTVLIGAAAKVLASRRDQSAVRA